MKRIAPRALRVSPGIALLTATVLILALSPVSGRQAPQPRLDPTLVRIDGGQSHGRTVFGTGEYLTEPSTADPAVIAMDYVRQHAPDFGLSGTELAGLFVEKAHVTPHDGVARVVIGQRIQQLRVHTAALVATIDREGRLVMVSGRTAPARTSGRAVLSARDAIGAAASRAGAAPRALPQQWDTRGMGRHRFANPYAQGLRDPEPVSAELVWFIAGDQLRLAWLTDVEVDRSAWYETVIDAETGATLDRESRYTHSGPDGTVFTTQHPDAPGAVRQRVDFSGVNGSWVDGTVTSGNNVIAYRDLDNSNAVGYQPSNADQHFRYSFTDAWRGLPDGTSLASLDDVTVTAALNVDLDAIITQLFYYTNDMHDWLWGYGFDEASGNFQQTNLSGEGIEGDPVLAEAQDGFDFGCQDNATPPNDIRCLNNANFGTAADGSTARMQMYMWARPNRPYRDGSLDGDVIAHEYGHGVSNRLVPNTISGATNQAGSLGEGWSDAISVFRWNDTMVGEYVTGNLTSGIRNFAYDVHPWTYGNYSLSVQSPHRNGEIWGATMYDMGALLGIDTATQLMLDGMRSTGNGPSPTFLDARDGILGNDQAANGSANRCALWGVFARRGMGVNAVSNGLHASPTQDFTLPADCSPTADANGPYQTLEGTDVTITAAASTPASHASAGNLALYEWDLNNNGQFTDATGITVDFTAVGQDGVFTVSVRVTDTWGNSDTDSTTVTVINVPPTVTIDPIAPIDEGGTTTISGVISDPGWLDILTAAIDFDDGLGAQPLVGVLENIRPDATFTFSVQKRYGDDGDFQVTVTGFDDDTSTSAVATAVVRNVDPTAAIDESGMQSYGGNQAFVVQAGEELSVPNTSTDPGSDDLTFTWDWADGNVDIQVSLVNPPALDPLKSPSVQPRNVSLAQAHTYADACFYDLGVTVTDDDLGSSSDAAAVIVTGNATTSKGSGWWLNQYRPGSPNDFTTEQLECYLAIAGYFSLVFPEGMARADAELVLQDPAKSPVLITLMEQLLAAWLNFANGAIGFDTPVATEGNRRAPPNTTFGAALLTAELVAINPASTPEQIRKQKDIIERIVLRDER